MDQPHHDLTTISGRSPPGTEAPTTETQHVLQDTTYLEEEVSLLELVNVLLRHWQLVIGPAIIAALLTAVISMVVPPTFTATTAFVPEAGVQAELPAGLAGLAGQFGLSLGSGASKSPQFYAQVLLSRELLNRMLLTRFADPRSHRDPPDTTTLLQILQVEGDSLAESLHNGRKELDELISVNVASQTNILTLSVDSRYPLLAAAVTNRFVLYLGDFNTQTRQSQARERRRFVEDRLAEADRELQDAAQAIKQFYERNRTWEQSPQLRFEHEQLQRHVQVRQELALTLGREYETARIAEVNDTPVITVIYPATPPQERSKPKRKLLVAIAFVLGGFTGMVSAFGAELWDRGRQLDKRHQAEFRRLIIRICDDVRRLIPGSGGSGK